MKVKICILCMLFSFLNIDDGLASVAYYEESLPKWQEMLKNGNDRGKRLALHNLWFLHYREYRKDKNVFDNIVDALGHKNALVREDAAACLRGIGETIQKDVDGGTWSRNCCTETAIVPSLIKALDDKNPPVRAEAAKALGMYRFDRIDRNMSKYEERAIDPLIKVLKDKDPWVRLNAAFSLGELRARKAVEPLIALLADNTDWRNKFVQQETIAALRKIGKIDHQLTVLLIKLEEDEYLKTEIIETFVSYPSITARELLLRASNDPNQRIRKTALKALSQLPMIAADRKDFRAMEIENLKRLLKDPSYKVRWKAINEISTYDAAIIPLLTDALSDKNHEVKFKAIEALGKINDEQIPLILISFIEANDHPSLTGAANQTFRVWLERRRKQVYIYRLDDKRICVEKYSDVPKGLASITKYIDLKIVSTLIDKSNANPSKFFSLLTLFEDNQIEPMLIKGLDNPLAHVRETAVRGLRAYGVNNVPKIIVRLKDTDPKVRAAAVSTLGELGDKQALDPIIEKLDDTDYWVKSAAIHAIGKFDDPRQVGLYIKMLKDSDGGIRASAAYKLGEKGDKAAVDALIPLLNDPEWQPPANAARALGKIGDRRAVESLMMALNGNFNRKRNLNGDMDLRCEAATALGNIADIRAVPALTDTALSQNEESRVRYPAAVALIKISGASGIEKIKSLPYEEKFYERLQLVQEILKVDKDCAVNILIDYLDMDDNTWIDSAVNLLARIKSAAAIKPLVKTAGRQKIYPGTIASALRQYGNPEMSECLLEFLKDNDVQVRKGAIILLGEFREKKAVEPLTSLLQDKNPDIRTLVKDAITKIASAADPVSIMMKALGTIPLPLGAGGN